MVRTAYALVLEQEVGTHRPPPRMLAPDPDAHSDAERIADLLRIRRRSSPWFLGFITAWILGTGAAAVHAAWGTPWWAWLTIIPAIAVGSVVGVIVSKRSVPSIDDAIARLRAHRFRPPPNTARPGTVGMVAALFLLGMMVAPTSGIFRGTAQADLWAFDGALLAAGGLTLYVLGRRTWSALAALPEAQARGGEAPTADA